LSATARTEQESFRFDGDGWPDDARAAVETLGAAVRELRERADQLQRALDSRVVIEQAKGVLAERLRIDPDEAFALLRGATRSAQMPLHELAGEVVATRSNPAPVAGELAKRNGNGG
jgi:hypothetical protein